MSTPELHTERLIMRGWHERDLDPFAAINADPEVMEHFPSSLSREESDAFVERIKVQFKTSDWGLWAVEVSDSSALDGHFIGYVGLWSADHLAPTTIEVGWRLARRAWGHGYAAEAATEALRYGFAELAIGEIVSFTVAQNDRSRRVMERIGLQRRSDRDFEHPSVDPRSHPHLVPHVLYSAERAEWLATRQGG